MKLADHRLGGFKTTVAPVLVLAAMLLLLLGCGSQPAGSTQPGSSTPTTKGQGGSTGQGAQAEPQLLSSNKTRSAASSPDGDIEQLVTGNNAFALDLLARLSSSSGSETRNLVLSPYSISLALAMTYAGAEGQTAEEMVRTMHFALPADRLHAAFNALDQQIASRAKEYPAKGEGDQPQKIELASVNQLWGQTGYDFLPEFLDILAQDYGAGMRLLDFSSDPEASRSTINGWVADATKDRIKDLLPPGSVDAMVRLVLTNAIYLKAPWEFPFQKDATDNGEFHKADGGTVQVPFMYQTESLMYGAGEGWQAVQLPYRGGQLQMLLVVPDRQTLQDFAPTMDAAALRAVVASLTERSVSLGLPRFELKSDFSLAEVLQAMGMKQATSSEADFSKMTGNRDLYIAGVYHNGFIAVDEAGTEAAAATAVVMRLTAAPAAPVELVVDRPFLWFIRDAETGTILFMGQVVDPAAGN